MLPDPAPISTLDVNWRVVQVEDDPMFALTPSDYEALSLNEADTLRWVREAKHRLDYYRETLQ